MHYQDLVYLAASLVTITTGLAGLVRTCRQRLQKNRKAESKGTRKPRKEWK